MNICFKLLFIVNMSSFPKKIFDEFKQTTAINSPIISQWNEKWDNLTYKETLNKINWDEIPFEERQNLVKLDCAAINELSYIKNLNIISTPYVLHFRNITKKKHAIKLCIYFHADKQFDITICSDIGKCPVSYGKVKNKTKINTWKTQLNQIRDLYP